jgi:hypothetical protein
MARKYELKRRAEKEEETRQRMVEAAIELHETLGVAYTTIRAIAERGRGARDGTGTFPASAASSPPAPVITLPKTRRRIWLPWNRSPTVRSVLTALSPA